MLGNSRHAAPRQILLDASQPLLCTSICSIVSKISGSKDMANGRHDAKRGTWYHRRLIMMSPVTLLLMTAVLAGASTDIIENESSKTDLLGDYKDNTEKFYYEEDPEEMQMSWEAAEEILELMEELGNVTSYVFES